MKTIEKFLSSLQSLNIKLLAHGDQLRVSASKGTLTSELRDEIANRKPEILSFLKQFRSDSALAPTRILPVPRNQEIPLSFSQQRLWFFDQQQGGESPVYNETRALSLTGSLDTAALEQSLTELVRRHESLRTSFPAVNGVPLQKISPAMTVSLPMTDLRHLSPEEQSDDVPRRITDAAQSPFDLSSDPLFRAVLLRLEESSYVLIVMTHHIIVDNWSMKILIRNMFDLYAALSSGISPCLPELPIQFADFACWHREWVAGDVLETQLSFWKEQLADAPLLLELPTDRPRPPVQTYRGGVEHVEIDAERTARLKALSEESGTTLFMTLLTGFATLLSRYSGQEDILIGSAIANRHHKEAESLVGMFVNNLVLRTDLSGNPTFRDALRQVRQVTLDAYHYQELPFEKLVEALQPERNPSYSPLIQVALAWQEMPVERPEVPGLTITSLKVAHHTAKFDLTLYMWEEAEHELVGMIEYNTDLFDAETIRRMWKHFERLLTVMVANPDQRIRMIPLFKEEIANSAGIPVSRMERLSPLTPVQRDLYLNHMIDPDRAAHHLSLSVDLGTEVDRELWERAVAVVAGQEDTAKTRLCVHYDEPFQFIDRAAPVHFEFVVPPLGGASPPEGGTTNFGTTNFDAPLFNNALVRNGDGHYMAVLTAPRILLDAPAGRIFFERVRTVYESLSQGQAIVPEEYPSFYDYVGESLHDFDTKEIWTYWQNRLKGVAPLGFLTGFTKEAKDVSRHITISGDHLKEISAYCKSGGWRIAAYFMAIYGIVLNRYFDSPQDFVICDTTDGRPEAHKHTLGSFHHTLPVLFPRNLFAPDASVSDCVDYINTYERELGSLRNISAELQQKILNNEEQSGFFFNLINVSVRNIKKPGFSESSPKNRASLKALRLRVHEAFPDNQVHLIINEDNDALELTLRYNEKFFSDLNFLERICSLSGQIIQGGSHFHKLDILLKEERHKLLKEWNDTRTPYPDDRCIHQLFEEQVERAPDSVALVFEDQQLTYQELNARANQLAHHLQTLRVGPEVLVGICVERSVEMIVGLLGILKAGGAYLPLDPAYPKERLAFMLEDSQVPVLLTQERLIEKLPEHRAQVVCLDTGWKVIAQNKNENSISEVKPENLVYVIYTSGSTGKPKGVAITHQGLCNLADAQIRIFDVSPNSIVLQFASFSFDASISEIVMTLFSGARLCLGTSDSSLPSQSLIQLLNDHSITHITLTPSTIASLSPRDLPLLRNIIVAGEASSVNLIERWSHKRRIFNGYGPTESTVCTTMAEYGGDLILPVGRPLINIQVYILDNYLQPVSIGISSELYIGGIGLARGYLNRPELTAEKFIPNPFSNEPGSRLYKTGDLVRHLSDGNIEFLGRIDHQVKIRGFRIELGEIEATMARHPAVREAVVIVREECPGDKRLTAYFIPNKRDRPDARSLHKSLKENFIPNKRDRPDARSLHKFLKENLPGYMIPSAYVPLEAMPLTPNGKIDRRALPAPGISLAEDPVAPRNFLEMKLAKIWEHVLSIHPVGVGDNFFDIGGHSLLAVRLLSQIQQEFGQNLPLSIFFQGPTVEHLANILRRKTDDGTVWSPLVAIQPNGSKPPFFCLPGQGGNPVYLYKLARCMNPDQPFFSFQAKGLDGESEPHTRIEDIAACHVEDMQTVQPRREPYCLGGHSFGAFVAFEMAQQLHRQGQIVEFLAILDIPAILPHKHLISIDQDDAQWLTDIAAVIESISGRNLGIIYDTLASLDPAQQLNCLKERMERVNLLPSGAGMAHVRGIVQVIKSAELALVQYEPKGDYPYPITLFRTDEPLRDKYGIFNHTLDDETWGWSQLSTVPVEVHHLPGDHGTLMDDPHVRVLAEALSEGLRVKG